MTPDKLLAEVKEIYGDSQEWAEVINEVMPEMLQSWLTLRKKVAADGAISRKTKEFILLGINLVRRYPSGIENHMRKALELGATEEEIMEVIATAVISSGAPAIMKGPGILKKLTSK